ncbi:cytosolic protein [Halobacillus yeomjeoni]|uniref:Cytosolic protein n=1 Tax=Halobacillus yeomjeoni TaxID=311194 RepID=A0A931MV16_9BACI|nr:cytosolic protein [Halobacillus yeomjeoni]MBH0230115.1 cytosolic protein [Halobacillus yeomjeoni]
MKGFISRYFSNHSETNEHHKDEQLVTHYYKAKHDDLFRAVEELFPSPSEVVATSKERGEITVKYKGKRRAFIVATVIMVRPYRTAVDFSVTTDSGGPVDFGFSRNLIIQFYRKLDSEFSRIDPS